MARKKQDVSIELAKFLRSKRIELGKTQEEVAKFLGVSQQSVGGYEKAKYAPSDEILSKFSELYDVPLSLLLSLRTKEMVVLESTPVYLIDTIVENNVLAEIDGQPLTKEEIEKAKEFIRALRSKNSEKK